MFVKFGHLQIKKVLRNMNRLCILNFSDLIVIIIIIIIRDGSFQLETALKNFETFAIKNMVENFLNELISKKINTSAFIVRRNKNKLIFIILKLNPKYIWKAFSIF